MGVKHLLWASNDMVDLLGVGAFQRATCVGLVSGKEVMLVYGEPASSTGEKTMWMYDRCLYSYKNGKKFFENGCPNGKCPADNSFPTVSATTRFDHCWVLCAMAFLLPSGF